MIWSLRNYVFYSEKYGYILYAGNSGSIINLTKEIYDNIKYFCNGDFSTLDKDTLKLMKEYGVIIDMSDDDLLNIIFLKTIKTKCYNKTFSISICPSDSCNFKCSYCFEDTDFRGIDNNNDLEIMSKETISNIVSYIKKTECKILNVNLFGGEPLLGINSIIEFHNQIRKLKIKINYDIITNGYLLNLNNIKILDKLPITTYQVSIDGFEEMHNKKRPHLKNRDSFEKIIDNLKTFTNFYKNKTNKPKMKIRVNIDTLNNNIYPELHKYIKATFPDYFVPYSSFTRETDKYLCTLNMNEKIEFITNNYHKNNIYEYSDLETKFKFNYCSADLSSSYVIDSKGNAYKCLNDIGKKEKILFNFNTYDTYNENIEADYLIKTLPFFDNDCKKCFLLFSCFGGCPYLRLTKKKECMLTKYQPNELLEMYYEKINTENRN